MWAGALFTCDFLIREAVVEEMGGSSLCLRSLMDKYDERSGGKEIDTAGRLHTRASPRFARAAEKNRSETLTTMEDILDVVTLTCSFVYILLVVWSGRAR